MQTAFRPVATPAPVVVTRRRLQQRRCNKEILPTQRQHARHQSANEPLPVLDEAKQTNANDAQPEQKGKASPRSI